MSSFQVEGARRQRRAVAGAVAIIVVFGLARGADAQAVPPSGGTAEIQVSHRARAVQQGEVVLLTVRSQVPAHAVTARGFERTTALFARGPRLWRGLIGIDLETPPGDYPIEITLRTAGDSVVHATHTLSVTPKDFPTRHLKVAPNFVDPPESVLDRIQRESKRIAAIFGTVDPFRRWDGPFEAPVPGTATSSFGRRSVFNGQPRSPHTGTDFRADEGTPVKSPNAGTVVLRADLYFAGNTVILDHGLGLFSYFAHLSRAAVEEGMEVATGDVIGYVGATGRVTGPHLHWTVRLQEARVDPLSLMAALSPESND